MVRRLLIILAVMAFSSSLTAAASAQAAPQRIVAVGDLHGDYPAWIDIAKAARLVGPDLKWTGGRTVLVQTGDMIVLDVPARRLDIDIPQDELDGRLPSAVAAASYANPDRGWEKLYVQTVQGADRGADLDFLVGSSVNKVSRESH